TGASADVADPEGAGELPGGEVAAAKVTHLPVPHQVVQGIERLVERGGGVPGMDLVEVDVVGLQAAEAGLHLLEDSKAGEPLVVRPVVHPPADLSCQDDPVAPALERFANDLLAAAAAVDVRRVE